MRRWLKRDSVDVESVEALDSMLTWKSEEVAVALEQLDEAGREQSELADRVAALQQRSADLELDLAVESARVIELERTERFYRERLKEAKRFDDLVVATDPVEWGSPTSVEELVNRLTDGEGEHQARQFVEFTGPIAKALEVDKRDNLGRYAKLLWEYIRVLHDYASLRSSDSIAGSVHMYLTNDDAPAGHKCAPSNHASTESDPVLNTPAWRRERVLPVPDQVDSSGFVLMDAHFKISSRDTFAPRMHYFDDTANSGKIYVGYIGRHLTNTSS